ncbi:MAG: NAD+ synthase, partial [Deltaproteobacteria bacterium]|nr:NAD+ synthase [Deltaproteobacteria bacterium]
VTGYPPMDLVERSSFIEANLNCLDSILRHVDGPALIVGYVQPHQDSGTKGLYNAAAVMYGRAIKGIHRKVLLPTYDVFDEGRYFDPGPRPTAVDLPFGRIGVTICEDIWNDKSVWTRAPYTEDPIDALVSQDPDVIVNVSASPFVQDKLETRLMLARRISSRFHVPVVYANSIGGNDGLVFDGESFVISRDSRLVALGKAFEEDVFAVDLGSGSDSGPSQSESKTFTVELQTPAEQKLIDAICLGIRDFCGKLGIGSVVVGLSGGIDSAVTVALAVKALGPEKVRAVSMPSRYSSHGTRSDAARLATNLGIRFDEIPIDAILERHVASLKGALGGGVREITLENLQARIRGTLLMAVSNDTGALVLNTGNKSELAVGYCTLYGDMVGGLAVIGDLSKKKVYDVARELNREGAVIPEGILTRPPSAELAPDQKDEDSLPPYPLLDPIVEAYVEDGLNAWEIADKGFDRDIVGQVVGMISYSEFKRRQAPVAIKVTAKAFGPGRRLPIVQRFEDPIE